MRVRLAALVALALLPAAAAQVGITNPADGPATLYFHLMGFQDFPINTQVPANESYEEEGGVGLATSTLSCLPAGPMVNPDQEFQTYYGYSTAGYVEYDYRGMGLTQTWPERQMGYNLVLDAGVPPILVWYVEATTGLTPEPPQVLPNVVVQATLRIPEGISVDDSNYNKGPVIAMGRSEPALLAGTSSQGVEYANVDGRHVYGFRVPLDLQETNVGATGYVLRIDMFLDNPLCGDPSQGYLMPTGLRPYTDPDHRSRITTAALEPLRITSLRPMVNGSVVEVHGSVQSVWGNYDVDEGNLALRIEGPQTNLVLPPRQVRQLSSVHGHHDEPVNVTWTWDRSETPDGLYRLVFEADNDQRTAAARAVAAVELGPDRA